MKGFHCSGCEYAKYTKSLIMKALVLECTCKSGCARTNNCKDIHRERREDDKRRV